MSEDERVTKDLIETLKDGAKGFSTAAERLADSDRADLSATMRGYSKQRASFAAELERMAAEYGDDIDESGSLAGKAHREWMAVKDAITGSSPEGVLDAAEQGEDHAVSRRSRRANDLANGRVLIDGLANDDPALIEPHVRPREAADLPRRSPPSTMARCTAISTARLPCPAAINSAAHASMPTRFRSSRRVSAKRRAILCR